MKKIINGKMYNTETATSLAEWDNNYNRNDFYYEEETLYRKNNGEFFVCGEGGPKSRYALSTGTSSWSGRRVITPLTSKEAYDWALQNLNATKFEDTFGAISEDNTYHL